MKSHVSPNAADQLPYYSETTKQQNDIEIERILDESYARVKEMISKNKGLLLKLADVAMMERCHLGGGGA